MLFYLLFVCLFFSVLFLIDSPICGARPMTLMQPEEHTSCSSVSSKLAACTVQCTCPKWSRQSKLYQIVMFVRAKLPSECITMHDQSRISKVVCPATTVQVFDDSQLWWLIPGICSFKGGEHSMRYLAAWEAMATSIENDHALDMQRIASPGERRTKARP